MKTQILQLEAHDDVVSILDKIAWAQTERVLLVLPRRKRVLHSKLDLLRIKRQSQKRGFQLALITDDPLIATLAGETSIPIFHSIQKAHQAEWDFETRQQVTGQARNDLHKPDLAEQIGTIRALRSKDIAKTLPIWARYLWFLIGILAVTSILAVIMPSAKISLKPLTKQQRMIITMIATERVEQARISGEVPISIRRIYVEGTKSIKVNGTVSLPKDFAKGEVTLTNLTDQAIEVPAGTIVRTLDQKPRRYATQRTTRLVPGNDKKISVPIQALEPGEAQNAQPFEIMAIEGLLGLKIAVENPQPIAGGSNTIAPAPSIQDRQSLFNQLQSELLQEAREKIIQDTQESDLLLPDSAIKVRILRQTYSPDEQIAANLLSLDLSLEVSFGVVERKTLADLGKQVLASAIPDGYLPLDNTFVAVCLEPIIQTPDKEYTCRLEVSRQIQPRIDRDLVRSQVLGKSPILASQKLQQTYPLAATPIIEIFPRWLPFLPWLPMRIDVTLQS